MSTIYGEILTNYLNGNKKDAFKQLIEECESVQAFSDYCWGLVENQLLSLDQFGNISSWLVAFEIAYLHE